MSWTLYRWTWVLRAPLYLGLPPAGSLNRTRLFVPARTLWGALTAELARHEARGGVADYGGVGNTLCQDARFGYLFPAEFSDARWRAWLPIYRDGLGLVWAREDDPNSYLADRDFRRRVLDARSGTAIDPQSDAAEEGSLRETECIQPRWRGEDGAAGMALAMTGYVFLREDALRQRLETIWQVFVGGDTRYGLGLMEREEALIPDERFFGDHVELDGENSPIVTSSVLRAHAVTEGPEPMLSGARERVVGWSWNRLDGGEREEPLWAPGSKTASPERWCLCDVDIWKPVHLCTVLPCPACGRARVFNVDIWKPVHLCTGQKSETL